MTSWPKRGAVLACAAGALALTACSSDVGNYLVHNHESLAKISMRDVYGHDWEDFAVQCPGVSKESMVASLHISPDDAKDTAKDEGLEYVYLRKADGELKTEELESEHITMCPNKADPTFTALKGWTPATKEFYFYRDDPKAQWQIMNDASVMTDKHD